MVVGATVKLAPLALEPMAVPADDVVYQFIVLPEEVAFRLEALPAHVVEGVALSEVGTAVVFTVMVIEEQVPGVTQPPSPLT